MPSPRSSTPLLPLNVKRLSAGPRGGELFAVEKNRLYVLTVALSRPLVVAVMFPVRSE